MAQIENRPVAFRFDRDAVREAYLNGERPHSIASRFGGHFYASAISAFISSNKQKWFDEARSTRLRMDGGKIVIPVRETDKSGVTFIKPVSLPRNSMYIKARAEARHDAR